MPDPNGFINGVALIANERYRQISAEGFSPEQDLQYNDDVLARAGACYAVGMQLERFCSFGSDGSTFTESLWPFDDSWWKPSPDNRIKELVKAGALIAAEIDRRIALLARKANG